MVVRLSSVLFAVVLVVPGCGLVLDLDPHPIAADAALSDGGGPPPRDGDTPPRDGSAPTLDGSVLPFDGAIDASSPTAHCNATESWATMAGDPVGGGGIEVAATAMTVGVMFRTAFDRLDIVELNVFDLSPTRVYDVRSTGPRFRLVGGRRLAYATVSDATVELNTIPVSTGITMTGIATALGASSATAAHPVFGAVAFGPGFPSPMLAEIDAATGAGIAALRSPFDGVSAIDACLEHVEVRSAYVVAWAEATGPHIAAVDDVALGLIAAPIALLPLGTTATSQPRLSLAISGRSAAVGFRGGAADAVVAIVDSTRGVSHLYASERGDQVAVASQPDSPVLGIARLVGDAVTFELRDWAAPHTLYASIPVPTVSDGDVIDLEAEPTPTSYLLARKESGGDGLVSVTRISCTIAR